MQYDEFIASVRNRGELNDHEHAEQAARATLTVLGQRLAGNEPENLAAQLPGELKGLLSQHAGAGERFDVDTFCARVADEEGRGCGPDQARNHAQAVLSTMVDAVSAGELHDLSAQLPAGYGALLTD